MAYKLLNIKPLGQRDPRWANQRLGTVNGSTLGEDGCVVTSHSMSLTFHGKPYLPNELDDFLTNNNLYYQGNLWIPANASKIWDQYKYIGEDVCDSVPAPIDKIKQKIDANQPPTLWLDNGGVLHNILAVGYDGNQIIANDPWIGDQIRIDKRWGDSAAVILEVDYYEGPVSSSGGGGTVPDNITRKSSFFDKDVAQITEFWGPNKNSDLVTEADNTKYIAWVKDNVKRAGSWDQICNQAGITNTSTPTQVFTKIQSTATGSATIYNQALADSVTVINKLKK